MVDVWVAQLNNRTSTSSDRSKLTIWGPCAIPLGTDGSATGVERKLHRAAIQLQQKSSSEYRIDGVVVVRDSWWLKGESSAKRRTERVTGGTTYTYSYRLGQMPKARVGGISL